MTIFLFITILGSLSYILLLIYYLSHWHPEPDSGAASQPLPFLSVVIAARNEEDNIGRCLQSVLAQTYPPDHYEVIVVNDLSEDRTADHVSGYPRVQLLHTTPEHSGKKQALSLGIRAARGEVIVTTDADCTVSARWLGLIGATMDAHTQMVTGPVLYPDAETAFARFQSLDLAAMALITAAGIRSGTHHLANGANMAFRKSAFLSVGGLSGDSAHASGDDVFLIQRIAEKYPQGIRYLWGKDSIVSSRPCENLKSFLSQRIRWATKNASLPQKVIYWIWIGIWSVFVLHLIAIVITVFRYPVAALIPILSVLFIFGTEFLVLRKIVTYYGLQRLLTGFLGSVILHYIYVVCMGFVIPFSKNYDWKGRKVR